MLTYAKCVLTFEIGIVPWQKYTFLKEELREECAFYFLLVDKRKIDNAEILTYISIVWRKQNNVIKCSVPPYSKNCSLQVPFVWKAHIVLNVSEVVL